jgi:hypothetical protein
MFRGERMSRIILRCWDYFSKFFDYGKYFFGFCFDLSHKCRKIGYAKNRQAYTSMARDMEGLNFGPDDNCTLVHLSDLECTLVHFSVLWPTYQNTSSRMCKTFWQGPRFFPASYELIQNFFEFFRKCRKFENVQKIVECLFIAGFESDLVHDD